MASFPRSPLTMRTRCEWSRRTGMKSVTVAAPSSVSNRVSRISVSGRYRRLTRGASAAGRMSQRPFSGEPSKAAKHAAESKRGQHSQSTEPSRATSTAVSQSPTKA